MESRQQRAFLRECFAFADARRSGELRLRELKCAVAAALGIRASKLVLLQMFGQGSGDNADELRVSEATFLAVMLPRLQKIDLLEHVRRSFKAFDLRSRGFITFDSFAAACASVMPHMPHRTMHEIFVEADRDRDGRVTYNDFETMYLLAEQIKHAPSISADPRLHRHRHMQPTASHAALPVAVTRVHR